MKRFSLPGAAVCAAVLLVSPLLALAQGVPSTGGTAPSAPIPGKPDQVTKLDGTKLFGFIEITDDYTIRITTDTGITKLPIADLSQGDFEKFTQGKDRSLDGKLWSDRKDALTQQQAKPGGDSSSIEIPLGKIAEFKPLIDAYKKANPDNKAGGKNSADASKAPTTISSNASNMPVQKLFSDQTPGGTVIGSALDMAKTLIDPATTVMTTATSAAGPAAQAAPGAPAPPAP